MLTHEVYNRIDVTIQASDCARHGGRQNLEIFFILVMNVTANFCTTRRISRAAVLFRKQLVQDDSEEIRRPVKTYGVWYKNWQSRS